MTIKHDFYLGKLDGGGGRYSCIFHRHHVAEGCNTARTSCLKERYSVSLRADEAERES